MADRHIVCFGNDLHGDDGFGLRVYARLCETLLPQNVAVFNAGIAGLDALKFLENCRQAILVDALANFGRSGEIHVLRPETLPENQHPAIGHGLGVPYLLRALKALCSPLPDIWIVGVEIAELKPFSPGLSPQTERAVPVAVGAIQRILSV